MRYVSGNICAAGLTAELVEDTRDRFSIRIHHRRHIAKHVILVGHTRAHRISQIKTNNGFVFRDRVVPIVALAELMKLPEPAKDAAAARLLVVIEAAGRTAAFEVEAIRDRLDVVLKPMHGLLENARGYAGTTLLGDGQVLLVLDVKELLP